MTFPFRQLTGQSIGWRELISSLPCSACWRELISSLPCSATFGLGGTWDLLEGVECLGCENPSMSTQTPSTLTLVGEHLEDESSFRSQFLRDLLNLRSAFGGSRRILRCHFGGTGGTPRGHLGGDRLNPYPSPKNTQRTHMEPRRWPIPSLTSRRKPEFWWIPIWVCRKNAR